MNYLSLYFLLKTALYYTHHIAFHWGWNLLLAAISFWPVSAGHWQRWRRILVWPVAIVLIYHESYLPVPAMLWTDIGNLRGFSSDYLMELVHRALPLSLIGGLLAVIVVYMVLSRWLRFPTFALAAIVSVPLVATWGHGAAPVQMGGVAAVAGGANGAGAAAATSPDAELRAFYASESQRRLVFPKNVAKFDLVVLHVCSMSWDDLDVVQERNAPFLKRFDLVFNNFNSAASYSGPAAYRLLRGNCGQTPHVKLYEGTDAQCYTFPALAQAGFKTSGLLNHNGIFDGFARIIEHEAGLTGHMESNRDAPVQMHAFDGSPVYDDFSLLSHWWSQRQSAGPEPHALYYNTISMHDGNRLPNVSASVSSLDTYRPRVTKLLNDFDKFISQIEATGKPVVVVLIPEHGASLRGDNLQMSGVREIPNSKITLVPVAIKLVGMKPVAGANGPLVVNQPMSFFGLNTLLADFMRDNPFAPNAPPLAQRVQTLETTQFVAENSDVVVMRSVSGTYFMKSADGTWVPI